MTDAEWAECVAFLQRINGFEAGQGWLRQYDYKAVGYKYAIRGVPVTEREAAMLDWFIEEGYVLRLIDERFDDDFGFQYRLILSHRAVTIATGKEL